MLATLSSDECSTAVVIDRSGAFVAAVACFKAHPAVSWPVLDMGMCSCCLACVALCDGMARLAVPELHSKGELSSCG